MRRRSVGITSLWLATRSIRWPITSFLLQRSGEGHSSLSASEKRERMPEACGRQPGTPSQQREAKITGQGPSLGASLRGQGRVTIVGTKRRAEISKAEEPMLNAILAILAARRDFWLLTERQSPITSTW